MPSASATTATKPALTLQRRLNASPAKVYQAWTDPKKITQWFGPGSTIVGSVRSETDVRVGGRFHMSFETDDGEQHDVSGVYRDIIANEKLTFSWAWRSTPERESLVTVTLKPDGDGTLLTLHHEQFFDETARDNHRQGWMGTLDRLEQYLVQS
jgi:uncharacterized protein YndB with AHSA1/START domain